VQPHTEHDRRWIALILLCFAQFIVVLDGTIVNIALPSIGEELSFSQENLSWVINAYVLTFGGFLLLGGRLADLLGRRRMFIGGLLLVAVASLAAGFAANEGQLIAARAAQGLGAAIIAPAALSIVTTTFRDGAERNKALGAWGAVSGAAGAAGVLLGGVLTDGLGWEWVMWVNVPVAAAVAALAPGLIAESRSETATRRFDLAGAVAVTGGVAVLVYALVDAGEAGWGSAQTLGLGGLAAALLAAFVLIERRSEAPLVPLRIFRIRVLTGANAVGLLVGASLISMFFFVTLYMQQVLGYSAIEAGLAYLPLAATIIVASGVASQLVTRLGVRPVLAIGMGLIAVALVWLSRVSAGGGFASDVLGPSLLAGAGLGFAFVPTTIAAVSGVGERDSGLASVATSRTGDTAAGDPAALQEALTEGFQAAFLGGAAMAGLGLVLTLVLLRSRADARPAATPAAREPTTQGS
jgi:EmrB/QacA subfamily drug resistance transporter